MLEDGEIIRRCLGGQTGAMDLVIDRYKTDLYCLCMKLARSAPDAEDLFQDTWLKVMKSLDTYNPERPFKTWLFAICTNRYRDLYRWRRRWWRRVRGFGQGGGPEGEPRHEHDGATMEADGPTPEEQVLSEESRGAVGKALDGLEDAFRLPIILHYFQGFSVGEIAEIMDIPSGTVKTRLSRGREKLRIALEVAGHGR